MKSAKKKWISIMASTIIVIMLCVSATSMVSAANTADSSYSVYLNSNYGITQDFTPGRAKTDTSSVYLKAGPSLSGAFVASPWACANDTEKSTNIYYKSCLVSSGSDGLVNSANKVCRLKSTIKEEGYSFAAIEFTLYTISYGSSTIKWSPDSVTWS